MQSAVNGDEPAVSPATRRRLVAFQLGNDVVFVVDACSCARATVRVLAGGPRQGPLSKRIGRAERVARLHNLSADVLIANVTAPVRLGKRSPTGSAPTSWLLRTSTGSLVDGADTAALLLAAGVNLANGGAERPGRRRLSADRPGQSGSRCCVGRRGSWRSVARVMQ